MGIKAFNIFLRKFVDNIKLCKIRTLLEEIASNSPHKSEIYQKIIPINNISDIINECQILGNKIEKEATSISEFEFSKKLLVDIPKQADYDPIYKSTKLDTFRGKRIAIDANNWMFCHISVAHKRVVLNTDLASSLPDRNLTIKYWLTRLLDDVCLFLSYGITPVFIFDGTTPVEKEQTRAKRADKKHNVKEKIENIKNIFETSDILDRNQKLIDEYKKLLCQYTYVSNEEVTLMKSVLEGIGIPLIQAKDEAEKLCSILTIEGKAGASFSTDTDNLTYGCPVLITGFNGLNVTTININDVLECLKMSYPQFVDLCIMAGCDYNENIPKIGIGKSYKLLKDYTNIENIPKYDKSCLKYERCRQLFQYSCSDDLIISGYLDVNKNKLIEEGRDILTSVQLSNYMAKLYNLYENLPDVNNLPPPLVEFKLKI
jgi:5'-3' exonuclease